MVDAAIGQFLEGQQFEALVKAAITARRGVFLIALCKAVRATLTDALRRRIKPLPLVEFAFTPQSPRRQRLVVSLVDVEAGWPDAALASYGEALTLFRQVGSRLGEANVLLSLGDTAVQSDKSSEAWRYFEQAQEKYAEIGDRYSQARVLYRQGDWQMGWGTAAAAVECYDKAVTLWRSIGADLYVEQILLPRRQCAIDQLNAQVTT